MLNRYLLTPLAALLPAAPRRPHARAGAAGPADAPRVRRSLRYPLAGARFAALLARPLRGGLLLLALAGTAQAQTTTFGYTGSRETYPVPAGVYRLAVVATGGSGGSAYGDGGLGAVVQATLTVVPGEMLTVVVGGQGGRFISNTANVPGGYNGGGSSGSGGGGGGGATDLRRDRATGNTGDWFGGRNALLVAGGGGGANRPGSGNGGTPNGGNGLGYAATGSNSYGGSGATTSGVGFGSRFNGGSIGNGSTGGESFDSDSYDKGGGGGGGYYGGGGGYEGGGGGSSLVLPTGASGISYGVAPAAGNGMLTITPVAAPVTPAPVVSAPANNAEVNTATPTYSGTAPAGSTVTVYVDGTSLGTVTATGGGTFALVQPTALAQGSHAVYATAKTISEPVSDNSAPNTFTVRSNTAPPGGNVGIGTTIPSQKLEVAGQIYSSTGGIRFPDNTVQTTAATLATGTSFIQNRNTPQSGASFNVAGNGTIGGEATIGGAANIGGNAIIGGTAYISGNTNISGAATISGNTTVVGAATINGNTSVGGSLAWRSGTSEKYSWSLAPGGLSLNESSVATGRLFVQDGGNVGIGTTTPDQKLAVDGNTSVSGDSYVGGTTNVGLDLNVAGNTTVTGTTNVGLDLNVTNNSYVGRNSYVRGTVGIGTTTPFTISPGQKLEVAGNVKISGAGNGLTFPDGSVQTSANALGNLTGDVTSAGLTTTYANVVPAAKGGAGNVSGLLKASGSGLVSAASPGSDYLTPAGAAFTGRVGIALTPTQPATQLLDVRGNVRLGTDGGNSATGLGQTLEFVGPGFNTDPVGLYRTNPASDASELRVVVGDGADPNDRFVVGRSSATGEGGIPTATFTPSFTVRGDGTVGIGTSAPAAGLHVDAPESGSSTALGVLLGGGTSGNPSIELRGSGNKSPYLDFVENAGRDYSTRLISQSGTLALLWGNAGTKPTNLLSVDGGIQATAFNTTSDARFKTNVRPLGSALASVLALRGVRYDWNALGVQHGGRPGAPQVGLLAQEVEKIYPELVSTGPDGYKAVNYAQLTPVLIEALKEQQQQIEALRQQVAAQAGDHAALVTLKARAVTAETKAAQATATLETFEARLRRLETAGGQAQR